MSNFVIDAPQQSIVPVLGGGEFPVRRIFCVGKNYADHVKEMGGDARKDPPVFFTKPADAIVTQNAVAAYPPGTTDLHFEGELVVALKAGGANIAQAHAASTMFGFAAGCDLTRRDLQHAAKAAGAPWDIAKAFDQSAPIGEIVRADDTMLAGADLSVHVNEKPRQQAALASMIWSVPEIIAALSTLFHLSAGDLIFTGTPAGVGTLSVGDHVDVDITGMPKLSFQIGPKRS